MNDTLYLEHIHISLQSKKLVELTESVAPGEVLTVMGPSGSGKSSLLAYIAGFLPAPFNASGRVRLGDEDVSDLPPEKRGIGLLFQDPLLFPHLSVGENLRFGIPARSRDKDALMANGLAEIGLAGFQSRDPATLSGGQKSRVALLRLLLSKPRAVLLDEPFSALDSTLRAELRQHIFSALSQAALPTILVTHDEQDAKAANGKVLRIDA